MKRQFAIIATLFTLFALTVTAGDGDKKMKHKECSMATQECLNAKIAKISAYAWDGIHVEGVGQDGQIVVANIVEESPGAEAGLKKGDVLVAMNGTKLASLSKEEFWTVMNELQIGNVATYAYVRNGQKAKVKVTMTQVPKGLAAKKIGWHMMMSHAEDQTPKS